jgi:heptaprenyl diphosphate synthase
MQSGKTPGTDLREGVLTLAGLYALQSDDPADARLRELLARSLPDDAEHAEALELLRRHDAVERAREEARRWADLARQSLGALPDHPARDVLALLCDYVVSRTG